MAPVVEAAFDTKRAELEKDREAARDVPAGTPGAPAAGCDCRYHNPVPPEPLRPVGAGDVPAGTPEAGGPPMADGGDVPAGTPEADQEQPARITDGDALLAMAQDALRAATPTADTARRNRFRMTASLDPLSGWGRLRDGELLPPTSLTSVTTTLPGPGGPVRLRPGWPVRLRPLAAAELRLHDLGRTQREVSANLRELLGSIDGSGVASPAAPGAGSCTRRSRAGRTPLGRVVSCGGHCRSHALPGQHVGTRACCVRDSATGCGRR